MINISQKADCCGCAACKECCPKQCISLQPDNEGYLYPTVDTATCIDCGLCEKVCPVLNKNTATEPIAVYAAKNNDEEVRKQSSSGGIFSLLAQQTLAEGGVVFGVRFDEEWKVVTHYCETPEDLKAFRGSKYVQSNTNGMFAQAQAFLKAGRKVLFSGTPCQIKGLKLFLRKEYENLLTVEVICHGAPSPKVWEKHLQTIADKSGIGGAPMSKTFSDIRFRDKRKGWKAFSCVYTPCQGGKETQVSTFLEDPFMRIFLADINLRPSCYTCAAKSGRSGCDIALADFWAIGMVAPELDDDRGVSLALIYTEKGMKAYPHAKTITQEVPYEQATQWNGGFKEVLTVPQERALFFDGIDACTDIHEHILNSLPRPQVLKKESKWKQWLRKWHLKK